MKALKMLQLSGSGAEAAAIYDCDLTTPVEQLLFAEVFRAEGDQIVSIRLVFDATRTSYRPRSAGMLEGE